MAKKKDEAPAGGKTVGGRTIAAWKAAAGFPHGSDENIANRINQLAKEGGYAYECSAATVAKWRNTGGKAKASKPARSRPQPTATPVSRQSNEGEGIVVLRQLVKLLGRDGVKRLVDGL
jgi:hypothetical protein